MQTFILASGIMVRRALKRSDMRWLAATLPALVLLLAPWETVPVRLVSLAAFLPSVFLLVGWFGSKSRIGLSSLLFRTERAGGLRLLEVLLPTAAGILLSALSALVVGWPPVWQFWLAAPLTSLSFTLLLTLSEEKLRFPGRSILGILWLWGISRPVQKPPVMGMLVFTEFPGEVLSASPESGGMHPDSFVLASLVLALLSLGLFSVYMRR